MNILLLTTIYPEPISYGINSDTKVVQYFASEWVKMGHRVVVFHLYTNPIKQVGRMLSPRNHGIKIHENEGVGVLFAEAQILLPHSFVPFKWQQKRWARCMTKRLMKEIADFTPDVISVHFPLSLHHFYSYIRYYFHKAPACAVFHGSDIRELQKRRDELSALLTSYEKFLFRSPMLMKKAVEMGIDESRSKLALSGIDTSLVSPMEEIEAKASKLESDEWRVVYVGKLNAQKRVDTIIKAVNKLKDSFKIHLDIVGDGPDAEALKQLAEKLSMGDTITFWGQQTREASVKIMKEADVFVMVSKNETFGLVYVEAMCQGCIAIGSKGEGIDGFIIDGENGFLAEPANVESLVEKMNHVFRLNEEDRRKIIMQSYSKASKLTDEHAAILYLGELCEL